jgi:hypothetical protein
MYRHSKRGFLLIVVLILLSLTVVAEMLTTRYLVNLRNHVHQRQQIIQQRVSSQSSQVLE